MDVERNVANPAATSVDWVDDTAERNNVDGDG